MAILERKIVYPSPHPNNLSIQGESCPPFSHTQMTSTSSRTISTLFHHLQCLDGLEGASVSPPPTQRTIAGKKECSELPIKQKTSVGHQEAQWILSPPRGPWWAGKSVNESFFHTENPRCAGKRAVEVFLHQGEPNWAYETPSVTTESWVGHTQVPSHTIESWQVGLVANLKPQ